MAFNVPAVAAEAVPGTSRDGATFARLKWKLRNSRLQCNLIEKFFVENFVCKRRDKAIAVTGVLIARYSSPIINCAKLEHNLPLFLKFRDSLTFTIYSFLVLIRWLVRNLTLPMQIVWQFTNSIELIYSKKNWPCVDFYPIPGIKF